MLSNIVHRQELEARLKDADLWVAVVDRALSVLDDEERLVLDRFYVHRARGNVGRLRDELGLQDDSSVYRRKDKALRMFTLALYGITESRKCEFDAIVFDKYLWYSGTVQSWTVYHPAHRTRP